MGWDADGIFPTIPSLLSQFIFYSILCYIIYYIKFYIKFYLIHLLGAAAVTPAKHISGRRGSALGAGSIWAGGVLWSYIQYPITPQGVPKGFLWEHF